MNKLHNPSIHPGVLPPTLHGRPALPGWAKPAVLTLCLAALHGQVHAQGTKAASSSSCPMAKPDAQMQGGSSALAGSSGAMTVKAMVSSSCPAKSMAEPKSPAAMSSSCPRDADKEAKMSNLMSSSCPAKSDKMKAGEKDKAAKKAREKMSSIQPPMDTPSVALDLHSRSRIERATIGVHPATMRHAFNDLEIAHFLAIDDCHAVVSHGAPAGKLQALGRHVASEHAPVFLHRKNPVDGVSHQQVLAVLRGESTDWRQLGATQAAPIHLYLHGGDLQRQKFLALLRGLGVTASQLAKASPRYYPDYEALDAAASADPHALVIGLKTSANGQLAITAVDGVMPLNDDDTPYALTLEIYLLSRQTAQGREFEGRLANRLEENRLAFDAFHRAQAAGMAPA